MKRFLRKAVLLTLFALTCFTAEATTYYINALTGNDISGNGSLSNPWRTLNHAFERDTNGIYVNSFASGDVVQLSAHTFIEIGQFNVPAGVSIEGAGIGQTILKAASSFYYYPVSPEFAPDKFLITLSSSGQVNGNQSLKNFTIDGDEKKLHGGIYVNRNAVVIENVRVQYVNFSGIWLNGSNNCDLVGLQLKDCAWGSSGWCSAALQIANGSDIDVHGFDINEGRGYGIKNLGHAKNAPFADIKIHDGSISVNPVGLWAGGAAPNISIEFWGGSFPGTEIYNCYVDNHISLVNDSTGQRAVSIKVHDNVFDILGPRANGKGYGLELSVNDAEVYNNWFYGGDNGIVNWAKERKFSNWNIHHNTFYFNRPKHTESLPVWPSGVITTHKNAIEDVIIANNTVEMVGETMDFLVFDNRADPVTNPTSNNITVTKNLIIDSQLAADYAHWENRVVRVLNGAVVTNVNVSANWFQDITGDVITGVTYASNNSGDPLITKTNPRPDPYYRLQSGSPLHGQDIGAYGSTAGGINVVENSEFDNDTTNWILGDWSGPGYSNGGNSFSVVQGAGLSGNNAAHVNIVNANSIGWTLQLMQQLNLMLQTGKTYEISFRAKAESTRTIGVALHGNTSDADYWSATANLTSIPQSFGPYTFTNTNIGVSGEASFNITFFLSSLAVNDVWIDKVSVRDISLVPVTNVSLSPVSATLVVGANQQLTNAIVPVNATNQNVTWTTSHPGIAAVSSTGLVTAVAAGNATITVTTADGNHTASAVITVVVPVTSVTVSPATVTKAVGTTQQLTKTIAPANATNQNVTWTTNNPSVATVSATGLVNAVSNGTAIITVTTTDGSKTAASTITVVRPVTSVTVSPATATKAVGTTQQLTKTIAPANATNQNVTWTTNNPSVATVSATGLVNAVSNGTATITVTTADGNKTATSIITVVRPVTSVSVSPTAATIAVGSTQQLTKTIAPANATNQNVTWSTSNTGIATVSAAGLVNGVSAGNATITVTTVDGNKIATSVITVVVPVTGVTVSPNTASVDVGNTQQLTNAITPSNATNQNVTWATSNSNVAIVNASGLVTAMAPGSTTITVTSASGNHTATASITVPSVNVVANPEFDNGTTNWTLGDWSGPNYSSGGNSFSVVQGAGLSGTNAAYVNIVNTNSTGWTLQLMQQLGLLLQYGKTYEISFMAKAESARTISAALHGNTTDVDYWSTTANLTTTAQNFGPYTFTSNNSGISGEASFNITFFLSSTAINDVWIDKVSVRDVTLVPPGDPGRDPDGDPDGRMYTTLIAEEITDVFSERVQVYPNPIKSGEMLYLTLPGSTGALKITDMMGRPHYRLNITKAKQEIATDVLSQGLYLLEYQHSAGRTVIKVIIK
jgi:uncharacterized protein YjdB